MRRRSLWFDALRNGFGPAGNSRKRRPKEGSVPLTDRWTSPVVPWDACTAKRKAALRTLWRRGDLSYKLNPDQKVVYKAYRDWERDKNAEGRYFVFDISRRWGKSFTMLVIAIEDAIRNKKFVIPYISKSKEMVMEIIIPLVDQILQDCPPDLRPKYLRARKRYEFATGSEIILVGMDYNPDSVRGRHLDKGFVDEAGFISDLVYVVVSILRPMMQGRPHARLLMGSTPPVSPAHEWSSEFVPMAKLKKAYVHRTIEDNPMLTEREIEEEIAAAGGREATACQRELFALHVVEKSLAIIPEFNPDIHVCEVEPPSWRDCYTVLDPGFTDMAAITYSYWHFEKSTMVVEGEYCAKGQSTEELATAIKLDEQRLWGNIKRWDRQKQEEFGQPFRRYSDIDNRLIADMRKDHGLSMLPVQKQRLDQMINALRVAFSRNEIAILPHCESTIDHLQNGTWRRLGSKNPEFARTKDHGHYDLVASVCYSWLSISRNRNPYPQGSAVKILRQGNGAEEGVAIHYGERAAREAGIRTEGEGAARRIREQKVVRRREIQAERAAERRNDRSASGGQKIRQGSRRMGNR